MIKVKKHFQKHIDQYSVENSYLLKKSELKNTNVLEYGNEFKIDWENGQKTGFLLTKEKIENFLVKCLKEKKY